MPKKFSFHTNLLLALIPTIALLLGACVRPANPDLEPWQPDAGALTLVPGSGNPYTTKHHPGDPIHTPTPDTPHPLPGLRTAPDQYIVQPGDTLGQIADRYSVTIAVIAEASNIANVNILEVGQELTIPVPEPAVTGPRFKIIPDSELVAGPVSDYFDVADFIYVQNGYLVRYQEEVDGQTLSGFQIIQRVAQDFSVNPRLLLAVLEYQSGWVTNTNPHTATLKYPLGWQDSLREGLYKQLTWAANGLNRGYYLWRANAVAAWVLTDGAVVPINPTINAGTAGMQYFFAQLYGRQIWEKTVTEEGIFAVYNGLFGYPFDYAYEPVLPPNLTQPAMQLPFEQGIEWAFTGGPHGGWGSGSGWAALDFAPYIDSPLGCYISDEWVVAVADGLVVRAENGAVVQDLDSDGREQTGWTVLYMHIETSDRVQAGTHLRAGERIGRPSCEGGFSDGTHVHIARRYNGEWVPADQNMPFVLDGWTSIGAGVEYNGFLQKGDISLEAWNGSTPENAIHR